MSYVLILHSRPFMRAIFRALEVGLGNDYDTLFALILLTTMGTSPGLDQGTLRLAFLTFREDAEGKSLGYNHQLVTKLIDIVSDACHSGSLFY
ncbi:unnamed protein product [Protopolystoma xenopodis]|uniref:CLEC16A/TT9 C-terminal domain-containing protein n=1 Tax=Protopolystoma xenopodis TaxID=117903 RepID=A0A448XNY2_9PLAT|nr:unnamed protein product [Protopolystoma xenopodis]